MIVFKKYIDNVYDDEDKQLLEEANLATDSGALRAAYIMVWLACAESIKRRFKDAGKRDGNAGCVVSKIDKMESNHQAIDKILLDEAHKYGFITDSSYTELLHIYTMRCIYGHPYEKAPEKDDVLYAVSVVVKNLLSHAVLLREGFIQHIIELLISEKNYIDIKENTIEKYALELKSKIDPQCYRYLLEKYWEQLEPIAEDISVSEIYNRGVIFTKTVLEHMDDDIYDADEWLDKIIKYPKTMIGVIYSPAMFNLIGEKAQDALVGNMLDLVDGYPKILNFLENIESEMTDRQQYRFKEYLASADWNKLDLYITKLHLITCFERLINMLKSSNFYIQNPAIDYIIFLGAKEIERLCLEKQNILGRNILQAAQGKSSSAQGLLEDLSKNDYPIEFMQGIIDECFVNEHNEIRLKINCLDEVFLGIDALGTEDREHIVGRVIEKISLGHMKEGKEFNSEMVEKCMFREPYMSIKSKLLEMCE